MCQAAAPPSGRGGGYRSSPPPGTGYTAPTGAQPSTGPAPGTPGTPGNATGYQVPGGPADAFVTRPNAAPQEYAPPTSTALPGWPGNNPGAAPAGATTASAPATTTPGGIRSDPRAFVPLGQGQQDRYGINSLFEGGQFNRQAALDKYYGGINDLVARNPSLANQQVNLYDQFKDANGEYAGPITNAMIADLQGGFWRPDATLGSYTGIKNGQHYFLGMPVDEMAFRERFKQGLGGGPSAASSVANVPPMFEGMNGQGLSQGPPGSKPAAAFAPATDKGVLPMNKSSNDGRELIARALMRLRGRSGGVRY